MHYPYSLASFYGTHASSKDPDQTVASDPCADPEWRRWDKGPDPPPFENLKNLGLLSNTVLDPLENRKATKPMLRHNWPAI